MCFEEDRTPFYRRFMPRVRGTVAQICHARGEPKLARAWTRKRFTIVFCLRQIIRHFSPTVSVTVGPISRTNSTRRLNVSNTSRQHTPPITPSKKKTTLNDTRRFSKTFSRLIEPTEKKKKPRTLHSSGDRSSRVIF